MVNGLAQAAARRLRRFAGLLLFRPGPALLLFGGATLASNWLWFGSGLFLGPAVGAIVVAATVLGLLVAGGALLARRAQLVSASFLVGAAVGIPSLALIGYRLHTGVPLLFQDGTYQIEEAMRFLLRGQDPYGMNYALTSMGRWHWYVNSSPNPGLFHYPYFPLTFLLPLPLFALAQLAHIGFDVRFVILAAAAAALLFLGALPWRWDRRYVVLLALFCDPFFYLPEGRSDILFLAALVAGVWAWEKERPILAALAVGISLAVKAFALFYIPLLALALLLRSGPPATRRMLALRLGAACALPILLTTLPFLLWHPSAFWADTVGFYNGTDPHSYPIQGFGLSALLLHSHVIARATDPFPFGLLQVAFGGILLLAGLRRVVARPTLATVLRWGTGTLAATLFTARFVNDNYLAALLALAVLAAAAGQAERDRSTESLAPVARARAA
jgi:hypothetical protein